jgi:SAM-dependent methyltransferase
MLRSAYLKAEPLIFRAIAPLMRRPRLQRSWAAQRWLTGQGVEIGAFESPTLTPKGSRTAYVDRVPAAAHRKVPEYANLNLVDPDIIDDGATLATIPDETYDYLVASHVFEHIEDPLAALKNWLRVVKPGGRLLIIVPDKRYMFDHKRPLTPIDHFFAEHENGVEQSRDSHYRDVALNHLELSGDAADQYVERKEDPSIHWHTFTLESFVGLLLEFKRRYGNPFEILETGLNVCEDYAVLSKSR